MGLTSSNSKEAITMMVGDVSSHIFKNGKLSTQNIKIKLEGTFAMVTHRNLAS